MALIEALYGVFESPSMLGLCTEVMVLLVAVWVAFLVGVIIGWTWKPQWVTIHRNNLAVRVSKFLDSSLSSSPCRALVSPLKGFPSAQCFNSLVARSASDGDEVDEPVDKKPSSVSPLEFEDCSTSQLPEEQTSDIASLVNEEDLEHLYNLVEMKDGGPSWIHMMDRSTPGMTYEAWRRDPKDGPPQYRSRTVFEDASPEIVRDFFWDDEFRAKWDEMLASSTRIDECPTTGTLIVQWVRKFPFFCSDREYIIGRRIWDSDRSYYCVTKGVTYPSIPRRDKPRRVDLYYSSWRIRAVASRSGDGQMSACEVLLFHHEDMGIPWEIAKLGIRQGMWGTVKKIEPGLQAYQKARASGEPLSQSAIMAQINTKINPEFLRCLAATEDNPSETESTNSPKKPLGGNIPKLLIIGGAVVIACSIDRGLLTKAFIFGVARRFGNIGKKVQPVEHQNHLTH